MGELDGKVAIITGAGRLRGIGRAAAVSLARLGAAVVVTGTGRDQSSFPDDEKAINWKGSMEGWENRDPLDTDFQKAVMSLAKDSRKIAKDFKNGNNNYNISPPIWNFSKF